MAPQYKITALKMGSLTVDKSSLTYGLDFGVQIEIPIWAAAIEGHGHRLLVDTGIPDRDWVDRNIAPCTQKSEEKIENSIRRLGWAPEDVQHVINTHFHYDHCGGNAQFPRAKFWVSAIEWEYALSPIATQQGFYDGSWEREGLNYFSYHLTGDHEEILPGIRVIETPGHTPGHQSVMVNTEEGIVAITGDALNLPQNLDIKTPPGILHDTAAALATIERIKVYADRLLAGHDPGIESYQDKSFPKTRLEV